MRILGIDPALAVTGYGVVDVQKNRLSLLEAGIIKTASRDKLPVRLDRISRAVMKLILDTKPQVMVLEKIYVHYRHTTTAFLLGQARGVICLASAASNIPLYEYAATRVRKALVGNGLASKYQVQRVIVNLLKLKSIPKYTDVTDALALAVAHSYISKATIYGMK